MHEHLLGKCALGYGMCPSWLFPQMFVSSGKADNLVNFSQHGWQITVLREGDKEMKTSPSKPQIVKFQFLNKRSVNW